MLDLVPRPGIEPRPPALGVWRLTHCTTREVPRLGFKKIIASCQLLSLCLRQLQEEVNHGGRGPHDATGHWGPSQQPRRHRNLPTTRWVCLQAALQPLLSLEVTASRLMTWLQHQEKLKPQAPSPATPGCAVINGGCLKPKCWGYSSSSTYDGVTSWETHQKLKISGFPRGTVVKNLPANAGDTGLSPGPGRSHVPRSN